MITSLRTALLLLIALAAPVAAQSPLPPMFDVSQLARFRPVEVGMFSSYDRTGLNDDGFSGAHSFLRKEGDGLVIAELKGPGALTRIWTPTPIDEPIEFYIDGDARPRIRMPFSALFSGKQAPFTGELVGQGLGGYYSYVPIEFARSIKVVVRAPKLQFYQINYALYAPGTRVRSGAMTPPPSLRATPAGSKQTAEVMLRPGAAVTLFESRGAGRITSLKLGPAKAFAGDARDIEIRMTWDGTATPAVQIPLTELFAFSFGQPAARSALVGTADDMGYFNLPMPYASGAKVELVSRRASGPPLQLRSEITVSPRGRAADEGSLHARWDRERTVVKGKPFEMLDVRGRGHVVGFALQVQGAKPGDTGFFEGDDVVTIDNKLAIHGTGTEDIFNGGWYGLPGRWNDRRSLPLSGALDYSRQLARTGGYRFLLSDAYSFRRSLKLTIEHGPERNEAEGDYAGTVFYYLDRAAGDPQPLLSAAERQVTHATAFRIGTNPFAGLDTLIDASLIPNGRETGSGWASIIKFKRAGGADKVVFDDTWGPPMLSFRADVPQKGRYAIFVDAMRTPQSAKLQLRDSNFAPVGTPVDFYTPTERRSGFTKIGELALERGHNVVILTMPERNPASKGAEVELIDIEGRLVQPRH